MVGTGAEISQRKDNSAGREAELLVLSAVCSHPLMQPRRSHPRYITEQTSLVDHFLGFYSNSSPEKLIL